MGYAIKPGRRALVAGFITGLFPLIIATGCAGRGPAPATTPSSTTPSPTTSAPTAVPPTTGSCRGDSHATRLMLTEADNGAAWCVAAGGAVTIYLHGTVDDRWSAIALDGAALTHAPSGTGALVIGVTGGFFAAVKPGTARLASFRAPCASAIPGSPGCDVTHLFLLTVVVG